MRCSNNHPILKQNRLVIFPLQLFIASGLISPSTASASSASNTSQGVSATEATRIQAFLDARYAKNSVWHSFLTVFGETIDCVDFFAQPGVKALAQQGQSIPQIPSPPPPPTLPTTALSGPDITFNGQADPNGNSRACPKGSVPILRLTADLILAVGGLDEYTRSQNTKGPSPSASRSLLVPTPLTNNPTVPSSVTSFQAVPLPESGNPNFAHVYV